MKFSNGERNPQAFVDETGKTSEHSSHEELQKSSEMQTHQELRRQEEIADTDRQKRSQNKTDDGQRIKQLSQRLSLFAVTATVGITAGISYLSTPLRFSVAEEVIDMDLYACVVRVENANEPTLNAVLQDAAGNILESMEIPTDRSTPLSFEDLLPETEYLLSLKTPDGKNADTHAFQTSPFVTFEATEEGKTMLLFNPKVTQEMMMDVSVGLWDSEGKDFSSNVYFDPLDASYILHEGLFADEYSLTLTAYLPNENDGERTYTKTVSLGTLEMPQYTLTHTANAFTFTYLAGEVDGYADFEISIANEEHYYLLYGEDVTVENGNITALLTQSIAEGTYTVSIWGASENGEFYLYNEIFKTEITI